MNTPVGAVTPKKGAEAQSLKAEAQAGCPKSHPNPYSGCPAEKDRPLFITQISAGPQAHPTQRLVNHGARAWGSEMLRRTPELSQPDLSGDTQENEGPGTC